MVIVRFIDELVAMHRSCRGDRASSLCSSRFGILVLETDPPPRCPQPASWSITVALCNPPFAQQSRAIPDTDWVDIDYPIGGQAQVAETTYTVVGGGARNASKEPSGSSCAAPALPKPAQRRLWPDWRHHAFITNRNDLDTIEADQFHRDHAVCELAIRDLKEGTGLEHIPSGHYGRQRRLARLRRVGPQPRPLDDHPRRSHHAATNRTRRTRLIALAAVLGQPLRHDPTLRFPSLLALD